MIASGAAVEEAEAKRSAAEARSKGGLEGFGDSDVHLAIADPQNVVEVLAEGVSRLREKSTWKVWQWPAGGQEFFDAESFRWDNGIPELILEELASAGLAAILAIRCSASAKARSQTREQWHSCHVRHVKVVIDVKQLLLLRMDLLSERQLPCRASKGQDSPSTK